MDTLYNRKRIFRERFNNDPYIISLHFDNDIIDDIFIKFDIFSDNFTLLYPKQSFLPYRYIFFRMLNNYKYPYSTNDSKLSHMDKIYQSLWAF